VSVASEPRAFGNVRTGDANTDDAVRQALRRAVYRLSQSDCQGLLTEFDDESGRPLRAGLDAAGRSISDHLGLLLFYDGSDGPRCRAASVLAFTTPGSRAVFICGRQFRAQERRSPVQTEVLLIHETLHTLGLEENPPTPQEISSRVYVRCVARTHASR
jgi:hypothetical protein